jgi:HEAT repeat protein
MAPRISLGISNKIVVAGVAFGMICASFGAQTRKSGGNRMYIELESESPEIRAKASEQVLAGRKADIGAVLKVVEKYLGDDSRRGTVKDNMLLLGKLRAVEAVGLLVRNLTFEVFYKNTKRPQTIEDLYPAVQALIDTGTPSLGPVLERLAAEDDELLHRTGAAVLLGILGRSHARALLKEEMGSAKSVSAQVRLRKVGTLLETLP